MTEQHLKDGALQTWSVNGVHLLRVGQKVVSNLLSYLILTTADEIKTKVFSQYWKTLSGKY